ncbi:MAG: recombinase family protein [Oscillospiraceae bacterium]
MGDTIITLEVSRLTRSTKQLCEIVDIIKQKRLRLVIVGSITVDCRNGQIDPMSQAFDSNERGFLLNWNCRLFEQE